MWLLVVALPLQGVSAATMAACGVGRHQPVQTAPLHSAPAAAAMHVHDQAAHHGHEHVAAASTVPKIDSTHERAHRCSVCAACCLAAALPPATLSLASVDVTDLVAAFIAPTLPAVVTEGLERPPRSFLA